jgi:hypothetical protein
MKLQRVVFADCERRLTMRTCTEAFAFSESRRFHWLQKACIAGLRKLRCFYEEEVPIYVTHVIDADTFIDRLLAQKFALRVHFSREPFVLLIGTEDYQRLMLESPAHWNSMFSFDAEYARVGRDGTTVLGLKVKVVPWMKGMLVMPKDSD